MPRYKASIQIELSRKEKIKTRANAPKMFRLMDGSAEVVTFEVKAINAEVAFKKLETDVCAGKFNQSIKGRNYTISPINEVHRLAETLEEIQNEDDKSDRSHVVL